MFLNINHPDFKERMKVSAQGAKLSITQRLMNYIANVSGIYSYYLFHNSNVFHTAVKFIFQIKAFNFGYNFALVWENIHWTCFYYSVKDCRRFKTNFCTIH